MSEEETDALLARSLAEEKASRNLDILDAAADAWVTEANVIPLVTHIIQSNDDQSKRCDVTLTIVRQAFVEGAMRMRFAGQDRIDAVSGELPAEATEEMKRAGRQALRDGGLLPAYTDEGAGGHLPILHHLLGDCWKAMLAVLPTPNRDGNAGGGGI